MFLILKTIIHFKVVKNTSPTHEHINLWLPCIESQSPSHICEYSGYLSWQVIKLFPFLFACLALSVALIALFMLKEPKILLLNIKKVF